jgi:hypothetical protein
MGGDVQVDGWGQIEEPVGRLVACPKREASAEGTECIETGRKSLKPRQRLTEEASQITQQRQGEKGNGEVHDRRVKIRQCGH